MKSFVAAASAVLILSATPCLADGLAVGAGKWFGRELAVDHVTCARRGDIDCTLLVREAADR